MAEQKHIGIIITSLTGGGAERVMLTLSQELLNLGHLVTVFSLQESCAYDLPKGLKLVYPLSETKGRLRGWFNTKSHANLLQDSVKRVENQTKSFDLTLVNLYEAYRLAAACSLNNCYYVIHNSYKQELKREMLMGPEKYLYKLKILKKMDSKHLLGVSKGVSEEFENASLFTPKSVQTIYNPSNIENITAQAQEAIELDEKQKFILHVGRAAKAKRHDILFQALKSINPEYKLVCLSANTKKLSKMAQKYGVSERVILPGFTQNPYAWMQKASAVILSSDFEGLPTVLIEAILCGTKVVSTNCSHGPSEIMRGDLAQFLSPVGDYNALADNVNRALVTPLEKVNLDIVEQIQPAYVAQRYLALCK